VSAIPPVWASTSIRHLSGLCKPGDITRRINELLQEDSLVIGQLRAMVGQERWIDELNEEHPSIADIDFNRATSFEEGILKNNIVHPQIVS
jgi:hypothetical protein